MVKFSKRVFSPIVMRVVGASTFSIWIIHVCVDMPVSDVPATSVMPWVKLYVPGRTQIVSPDCAAALAASIVRYGFSPLIAVESLPLTESTLNTLPRRF